MNHDNEPKDSAFRLATLSRESNVTKGAAGTAAWEHETSKRNQPQPGGLYEEVLRYEGKHGSLCLHVKKLTMRASCGITRVTCDRQHQPSEACVLALSIRQLPGIPCCLAPGGSTEFSCCGAGPKPRPQLYGGRGHSASAAAQPTHTTLPIQLLAKYTCTVFALPLCQTGVK